MKYPLAARTTLVGLVGLFSIHPAPAAPQIAEVSFSPSGVYGGAASTGTLRLPTAAPRDGLSIAFASANPQAVTVPASVTVPPGAKVVRFRIQTQPVAVVTDVVITAKAGAESRTVHFRVVPPAPRWVQFSPNMVTGGAVSSGTVNLTGPAPNGGLRVMLRSRNASLVTVPDSITAPAGSTSVTFPVQTGATDTRVGIVVVASTDGVDKPASSILGLLPAAPTAPVGLSAVPGWDAQCTPCDNMPMPEIALSWQAVPGAVSYTLCRDGQPLQAGLIETNCDDMTVESGKPYTYTVKAVNASGESAPSAPATATALFAPAAVAASAVPMNVTVKPFWNAAISRGTDILSWSPVAGASSYNVYRYDTLIGKNVTDTTFTVPPALFASGLTYSVTAVDASGSESIPSAIAQAMDAFDPNNLPNWVSAWVPNAPNTLTVTPEANAGQTRNRLEWRSDSSPTAYNIYRDGALLVRNITGQVYLDTVNAGETHTYTVSSVNTVWPTPVEGGSSESVRAVADVVQAVSANRVSAARAMKSGAAFPHVASHSHRKFSTRLAKSLPLAKSQRLAKAAPQGEAAALQIVRVVPNDDSAVIVLPELPAGAADYRVYDAANPNKAKYAGRRTNQTRVGQPSREPYAIEWNGIDPVKGVNLIVEAVDKLGPFQKMDGMPQTNMSNMDGMMKVAINGQGDPSNIPNVVAKSAPFHVDCAPRSLTGSQVFFDNFRGSQPFRATPMPAPAPDGVYTSFYAHPGDYQELENDKWVLKNFGGDLSMSKFFFMGNHFMDTVYDGGGPGSPSPVHNNNASMVMMPKAVADISGGKTLHITFEVDAHFNSRRWCDVFVAQEGDLLVEPGKFADFGHLATLSGRVVRWEIRGESHFAQTFDKNPDGSLATTDLLRVPVDEGMSVVRILWDHVTPMANGTTQDLDKRHHFDLWLSKTRIRIQESDAQGNILIRRDGSFPGAMSLPFERCQVYFVHQIYHTGNDRPECMNYGPWETYWINHRPWADERHWDNMGQEVLDTFPAS